MEEKEKILPDWCYYSNEETKKRELDPKEEEKTIKNAKMCKTIAAIITFISGIRVLLIDSHSDSHFYSNDVAQVTLEMHQVVQIGVAAVLFTITLLIIADLNKNK